MKAKPVSASAIDGHIYKIFPNDLNSHQTVFGGVVMAQCDRLALVVAERHSGQTCVTASVDSLHFLAPARQGETLLFYAAVNRAWRSSMEVGLKVVSENSKTGERRHIVSSYFTFVALDDAGKPAEVPSLETQTPEEEHRYRAADLRRQGRLDIKEKLASLRSDSPAG